MQPLLEHATHLSGQGRVKEAVQVYRKLKLYSQARECLFNLAQKLKAQNAPLYLIKDIYISAGLQTPDDKQGWRPAEAYHYYITAREAYKAGKSVQAFFCALSCKLYDDILPSMAVQSLVALTSIPMSQFGTCSHAFVRLEATEPTLSSLAYPIFKTGLKNSIEKSVTCGQCGQSANQADALQCYGCGQLFPRCIVSGQPLSGQSLWECRQCHHQAFAKELGPYAQHCPLCLHAFA